MLPAACCLLMLPADACLLHARLQVRLASSDSPSALPRCAALVHASRDSIPRDERLLRPLPLLLDTALRCVYACPRVDETALELMTVIYKALQSDGIVTVW